MASLPTLPVEMIHRIFDDLDSTTIFLSVRDVCQSLRAATKTYHRYELDLSLLSKPDFYRLLSIIRPECVTALSLSGGEMTPGQIGLFLLLVNIRLFTRLRSLTLLEIDEPYLRIFLRHASRCSLTSLTLRSNIYSRPEQQGSFRHLSSIIAQPSLLRLELLDEYLSRRMDEQEWPVESQIRYLRMVFDVEQPEPKCLHRLPNLETFLSEVENISFQETDGDGLSIGWFSIPCPRLTALTMSNNYLEMHEVQSLPHPT